MIGMLAIQTGTVNGDSFLKSSGNPLTWYLKPCNIISNSQFGQDGEDILMKQLILVAETGSDVNQELDIIVTQKEATAYGLPIEVYFFTRDKVWAVYERKQSDIFDHLMSMVSEFGLRLYQRP